jgi:outer membrane protein OmpA-like peptidoglycan-associated protein
MVLDLRLASRIGLAALALSIAACSTTGPTSGTPSGATPGAPAGTSPGDAPAGAKPAPGQPAPALSPMQTEQRFLEDWFRNTPVVIATQGPTTLQVDVPLVNSFDAGKADIKPALGAVLERVAESLRRQIGARITLAAPADAAGPPTLAQARAQRVRDHLVARRIAAPRITLGDPARVGGPVQMRLVIPPAAFPAAVSRSRQGSPAPADRGLKPVSTATDASPPPR